MKPRKPFRSLGNLALVVLLASCFSGHLTVEDFVYQSEAFSDFITHKKSLNGDTIWLESTQETKDTTFSSKTLNIYIDEEPVIFDTITSSFKFAKMNQNILNVVDFRKGIQGQLGDTRINAEDILLDIYYIDTNSNIIYVEQSVFLSNLKIETELLVASNVRFKNRANQYMICTSFLVSK
jgi:hypothetical protein